MVVPIVMAGAIGPTAIIILALVLLFLVTSKEEVGLITIAAVVLLWIYMTKR